MHQPFGSIDEARRVVGELVERYRTNRDRYESSNYNEETTRNEFVTPFFETLGWDVANRAGAAEQYKDVIHEESIRVGEYTKAPDYTFRFGGIRKFFVEAKKPSIDLRSDPTSAYQLRRYAWSAKLPVSILTDFQEFVVYDTRIRPRPTDKAAVGRILYLRYEELQERLDEIWNVFSKDAVLKGSFDRYIDDTRAKRGTSEVDEEFLKEIDGWREELAKNLAIRNGGLSADDLNFAVQITIDRIIFLRIAEGRGAEMYGRLLGLTAAQNIYPRLVELYRKADLRYNSGLFDFGSDKLTPTLHIDDKILKPILAGLYYPQSPYEFSVLPAQILGNVYEQFLGKVIRLTPGHRAVVEYKPEIKKAGGVYYTPEYIVEHIIRVAVGRLSDGKSPKQMEKLRILDPACGSGSFLIAAYQRLLDAHLGWYMGHEPHKYQKQVFLGAGGWRLTTAEKRRILVNNIYGVDIDSQAVEVTKLSLLLKVLEGENNETLATQALFGERALPSLERNIKCGNSLIAPKALGGLFPDHDELRRVNPFDWNREFSEIITDGGFDAVVGNPPYLNIDDTWGTKDLRLQLIRDSYPEIYTDKTDILFYFLAKAVQLCRGTLSFIVSRAFLEAYKAAHLRSYLLAHGRIESIIDFQNFYAFRKVGITTCIITLHPKQRPGEITVSRLHGVLSEPRIIERAVADPSVFETHIISQSRLSAAPWNFSSDVVSRLNDKLDKAGERLDRVLRVGQGMQTGRNDVFACRTEEEIRRWKVPSECFYKRAANSDIQRFGIRDREEYVLFLEDVERFEDLPVGVQEHLRINEKLLKDRAAFKRGNCEWWKFTWPLHKEWYRQPAKLLCPYLSPVNRFALDSNREFLGLTDTTVLFDRGQPENIRYVLALLNSKVLTFRFRSIGKLKSGGIFEYFWNGISRLSIRRINFADTAEVSTHDSIVKFADEFQEALMGSVVSRTPHDRAQNERKAQMIDDALEGMIRDLYRITPEEGALIDSSIAQSSSR